MLNKLADGFEDRLRQTTLIDVRSLCIFRILFGLFTILFFWPSYGWIGTVPDSFFHPPLISLTSFLKEFPPALFFQLLDLGVVLFTVTLTIGLFTRTSTLLLFLFFLGGQHFKYSFGKIDHDILYFAVLFVMIFKDWGRFLSVDSLRAGKRQSEDAPISNLSLLGLFTAFGFFTAGYEKSLNWVDFDITTSGFLNWLYGNFFVYGRDELLASYAVQLYAPWLWEIADGFAVAFEMTFFIALLWRKTWYIWLAVACFFHWVNCLFFNIPFVSYPIVYLAFIPWNQWTPARRLFSINRVRLLILLFAFSIVAGMVKLKTGAAFIYSTILDIPNLWISLLIWPITGIILLLTLKTLWRQDAREDKARV